MSKNKISNWTASDRADLAAQVKRVRQEMGLTQAQLADEAKVTRQSIGNIEGGQVTPQANTIEKVLKVLNIVPSAAEFSDETMRWLGIIGGMMDSLPLEHRPRAGQAAVNAVTTELVSAADPSSKEDEPSRDDYRLAARSRSADRGESQYD